MPAYCDERGECWSLELRTPVAVGTVRDRLQRAAAVLWARLRAPQEDVPLCVLAVEVDAVGAAAVGLLAERADWHRAG
jgi:hypothetical protein